MRAAYVQCRNLWKSNIVHNVNLFRVINKLPVYSSDDPHSSWNDSWFTEQKMTDEDLKIFITKEHSEIFHLDRKSIVCHT